MSESKKNRDWENEIVRAVVKKRERESEGEMRSEKKEVE